MFGDEFVSDFWITGLDGYLGNVSSIEETTMPVNPWRQFELASANAASINGGITAVSRIPNSMEVWWIGANGSVQGAFWYEGSQWQRYELAPADSASTRGGITSVSRVPNSMEVWWIGADGSVQDAYWYEGSNGNSLS